MLLCCLFLLALMICGSAHAGTVMLEWGTVAGADGYKVYTMPVGEQPITTPARTPALTVPAATGTKATGSVTVPAGSHSFFVTAYNGWGESAPSNIVSTPPLVVAPGSLRVVVTVDVQAGQ